MVRLACALSLLAVVLVLGCGGEAGPSAATETRTVEHAKGTARVPAQPQRLVVLDTGELDSAVALGVTPVGAAEGIEGEGLLEYLEDRAAGVELVGTTQAPNLEAVAALRPDLILSSRLRNEDIYDELQAIAPTVFTETVGVAWKENFALHARALGREERGRALLAEYDERAGRIAEQIDGRSIGFIRFFPGEIRAYQRGSFAGSVLDDVGAHRPPSQRDTEETFEEISSERVSSADADLLLYSAFGPENDTQLAAVVDSPRWRRLDAVRRGAATRVDDDIWGLGIGIGAAQRVLDDLERLAGSERPAP